jgi:hypothetical protein
MERRVLLGKGVRQRFLLPLREKVARRAGCGVEDCSNRYDRRPRQSLFAGATPHPSASLTPSPARGDGNGMGSGCVHSPLASRGVRRDIGFGDEPSLRQSGQARDARRFFLARGGRPPILPFMSDKPSRPLFSTTRLYLGGVLLFWALAAAVGAWIVTMMVRNDPGPGGVAPLIIVALLVGYAIRFLRCPVCHGYVATRNGKLMGFPRLSIAPRKCLRCGSDLRLLEPWASVPRGDLAARIEFNRRHGSGPHSFDRD